MSVLNVKLETKIPSECLSLDIFGVRTIKKFSNLKQGRFLATGTATIWPQHSWLQSACPNQGSETRLGSEEFLDVGIS